MSDQTTPREGFSWTNRRRAVWTSLVFCGSIIVGCLSWVAVASALAIGEPADREVFETAIVWAFMTGSATLGAYCFGAAYENRGLTK